MLLWVSLAGVNLVLVILAWIAIRLILPKDRRSAGTEASRLDATSPAVGVPADRNDPASVEVGGVAGAANGVFVFDSRSSAA